MVEYTFLTTYKILCNQHNYRILTPNVVKNLALRFVSLIFSSNLILIVNVKNGIPNNIVNIFRLNYKNYTYLLIQDFEYFEPKLIQNIFQQMKNSKGGFQLQTEYPWCIIDVKIVTQKRIIVNTLNLYFIPNLYISIIYIRLIFFFINVDDIILAESKYLKIEYKVPHESLKIKLLFSPSKEKFIL
ncbi:hypothetical protein AGLY_004014 [Aphis glycines]|uniref:Uncharacterized protein n=1 Tax=Aphis glycines TaxID=307491 RepID=A0A6G0TWV0_APHGL|nr:hypothetical protein AGLY_004014 [Aphis glycines]